MKWLVIAGGWTLLMVLAAVWIENDPGNGGSPMALLGLPFIWGAGILVTGFLAAVVADVRIGPPTGPQLICTTCGATLFEQWRSGEGDYKCRSCGTTTAGRMSDVAPPP